MGSTLEIGIRMSNMLSSLTKACYRFVCCHPCLVCFMGFLIIVCRRFPFGLSILVYMSHVLVCTGVLLGTLLYFGQFNSAEVQKETKFVDNNVSSFQKGFSEGFTVNPRRYGYESIIEESSIEEANLVKAGYNDGLLSLNVPMVDRNSLKIQLEKQVKEEMQREVYEEKLKAKGFLRNFEAIQEEEEEESSELGSDDIESFSPDASMVDIIPALDELHPLLDLEGTQTAPSSCGGSGAESENSLKSDDGSVEFNEDTEMSEYEEMPEYEEEEAEESGVEDESKSIIRWTEDDQKNLMDLGSLELERNQRLENIIAKRRAWRLMNENLIDFESTEVLSNVSPIVTRHNPFDLPNDSYDSTGLPPIPGSAPSVLQPKKNPFDISFDSNEEKPVPNGDSPKEESYVCNQKDSIFRRHGSFSLGPSVLWIYKHERHDKYCKPVFVSEQMASEETSYSSFQRQQSETSDSKLSSVPESESVSSTDQEERMFNEQYLPQEEESISTIDHVSGRVECGSQSPSEVDSREMIAAKQRNVHHEEVEIVLGGVENNSESEYYSEAGEAEIDEEFNIGETHLRTKVVDEESSSKSSRSSLSEVIDDILDLNLEKSASVHQEAQNCLQESRIMTPTSVEDLDLQFECEVEELQNKEPVYDSSPPASRKPQTFYSIYLDSTTDFLERTLPPASAEKVANVTNEKSELHDQREDDDDTCDHPEDHSTSSQPHTEKGDAELHQDLDKKAGFITSNCQHMQFEEKPPSDAENNLSSSYESDVAASIDDHNENQDVGTSGNGAGEFYDTMNILDSPETPEFKTPADGSPKDVKRVEAELGIPITEVRSAEDIDLSFKQLQGVVVDDINVAFELTSGEVVKIVRFEG